MHKQIEMESLHFTSHWHYEPLIRNGKRLMIWEFTYLIRFCSKLSRVSQGGSFRSQNIYVLNFRGSRSEQNYSDLQVKHPPSQSCNPSQSAVPLLTVWRSWICSLCPTAFPFFLFPEARWKLKGPSAICTNHLLVTGVWKTNGHIHSFLLFPVFTVLLLQDCEAAASD